MVKHPAVYISLITLLLFIFSSCPNHRETHKTEEQNPPEKLVVWTHEYPSFNKALEEVWIPAFEEARGNVEVEYEYIPFSGSIVSYNTRVLAAVAAGEGPDTWDIGSWNFMEDRYVESGLVAPLSPEIFGYDSADDLIADYPVNSMNAFVENGKVYALFNELSTLCLFYNKTMFDRAGIPYLREDRPVSWDEVRDLSRKLTRYDPVSGEILEMGYQFGFFARYHAPQWYSQMFYPFMRQLGQFDFYRNQTPDADSEGVVGALQMFYDFTHSDRVYDPFYPEDWFSGFAENRVAMVAAGSWFPSVIEDLNPEIKFGVVTMPVMDPEDSETYKSIIYSFGWAVNPHKSLERQVLAQEFLAFILGKKGESQQPAWWFEHVGFLQPRIAFYESESYRNIVEKLPWMRMFDRMYTDYAVDYYQHSSDKAGDAMVRAIDRVVYNKMLPRQSAELMQNELILMGELP